MVVSIANHTIVAVLVILSVALPARTEKEIATADTGNPTLTTGDAPDSICPYGWRLPGYNGKGTYYSLMTSIYRAPNNQALLAAPTSLGRSGRYEAGSPTRYGSYDAYWNRVPSGSSSGTLTYFDHTGIAYGSYSRGGGFSVRCLAR